MERTIFSCREPEETRGSMSFLASIQAMFLPLFVASSGCREVPVACVG